MPAVDNARVRGAAGRPAASRKLAVTVLCGGPSREREISLHSGAAVAEALKAAGCDVVVADAAPDNLAALAREVDAVFIALHGAFGEDGRIQSILETRGLAYTGSPPQACELAMNKVLAKRRFLAAGLPTPRFDVATSGTLNSALAAWTLPVVVKPVSEGSSIACHVVHDFAALRDTANEVLRDYGEVLIEQYVPGLELTVGILGDQALPPIEIRPASGVYDYHAKYLADDTVYSFDIDLPPRVLADLARLSLRAFDALGCRDLARVDWRYDPASGQAMILELNTVPGFTSHSLLPMAARRAGLEMPELCRRLVDLAVARPRRRRSER